MRAPRPRDAFVLRRLNSPSDSHPFRPIRFGREGHHPAYGAGHGHPGPSSARWRPVQTVKSLLPTPIAVMKEREEARALRTDRGERLAVRRSPTRFRCAFFGPSQLHARRSGRCAGGGVAPIALASGAKLRACQVRTAAAQIAPGGAKCDFSPSDAKQWLRGCSGRGRRAVKLGGQAFRRGKFYVINRYRAHKLRGIFQATGYPHVETLAREAIA